VRYNCNQCNYKATTKGSLNRHKQLRHEKVINHKTEVGLRETRDDSSLIGRFRQFISQISPTGEKPEHFPELEAVLQRDTYRPETTEQS
jgi:hypothetical protein